MSTAAETGPVELVIIGFPANRVSGDIAPALLDLVARDLVRIVDLAVVSKDAAGMLTVLETDELGPEASAFCELKGETLGLLSEADLEEIAEELDSETTVVAILYEQVWAGRFVRTVRGAGGKLVLSERIPSETVAAARAGLLATAN
jgi:hypothetical protein